MIAKRLLSRWATQRRFPLALSARALPAARNSNHGSNIERGITLTSGNSTWAFFGRSPPTSSSPADDLTASNPAPASGDEMRKGRLLATTTSTSTNTGTALAHAAKKSSALVIRFLSR
jgi:hypothetical protein